MKTNRQSMILEIISQENIETQEQLLSRLQERGITLSFGSDNHLGTYPIDFEGYYGLMEQHGIDTNKLFTL